MSDLAAHQGDDDGTLIDRRGSGQRVATHKQTRGRGMKTIVALPGEGIGPEVVDATLEVLAGTGLPFKILTPPQGRDAVKSHGVPLPDETKQAARAADGVLFGAAGGPETSAVVSWLRWQ